MLVATLVSYHDEPETSTRSPINSNTSKRFTKCEWLQMFLVHLRTGLVCIFCCLPRTTWAAIIFNQRCFDSSLKGSWNAQHFRNCCFDIINHLESIWFRSIETNFPIYHESNLFYCLCDKAQNTNFSLFETFKDVIRNSRLPYAIRLNLSTQNIQVCKYWHCFADILTDLMYALCLI